MLLMTEKKRWVEKMKIFEQNKSYADVAIVYV